MIPENGMADEVTERLKRTVARARSLEVIIVILAAIAVFLAAGTATYVGYTNHKQNSRIEDCTNQEGKCYQQNQKQTAEAIQTILNYIDAVMAPHRVRNEAENLCSVLVIHEALTDLTRNKTLLDANVYESSYQTCVLGHSGNTPPPSIPNVATSTTVTTRENK